jgi:hypothetical protein
MSRKYSPLRKYIWAEAVPVQVACSYTNTGLCGVYLTRSGQVCREEFGYVEDVEETGDILELSTRSWPSIKRLQRILARLD